MCSAFHSFCGAVLKHTSDVENIYFISRTTLSSFSHFPFQFRTFSSSWLTPNMRAAGIPPFQFTESKRIFLAKQNFLKIYVYSAASLFMPSFRLISRMR